jgi:signal peptidase II
MPGWKFIVGGIVFLSDQAIKTAIHQTDRGWEGSFFALRFIPNYEAAFSLPIRQEILVVTTASILLGLIYILKRRSVAYVDIPLVLIIAGGISNLLDRLAFGYVIDYLWTPLGFYNGADIAIFVGAVWGIGAIVRKTTKEAHKEDA